MLQSAFNHLIGNAVIARGSREASAGAVAVRGGRLQAGDGENLLLTQGVLLQKGLDQCFQLVSMFSQETHRFRKTFIGDSLDLGVNVPRRGFAVGSRQSETITRAVLPKRQWSYFRAHPPSHHHLVSDHRDLLQVARRASRQYLSPPPAPGRPGVKASRGGHAPTRGSRSV